MAEPLVVTRRADLRAVLDERPAPGMVPTMGALHAGHEALIARAAAENPATVVTIFVNPTQFGDPTDFARYPRSTARDLAVARAAGADIVFMPNVDEVYPPGFATAVDVGRLGERWEGVSRPGHFRGVATVVAILFGLVRPGRAYFGEKDFQQLQIIRRMHADLALPGLVVGCPTVREADGLARSSRNRRLDRDARHAAAAIPRALAAMRHAAGAGERDANRVRAIGLAQLEDPAVAVDYLAIVDADTLDPVSGIEPNARALLAATVGGLRLIDNLELLGGDGPWES